MPKIVTTLSSRTATAPGCETATLEELVVEWQPPPVPMEEAAGSVASQVGHFLSHGWPMAPRARMIWPKPAADGECLFATQRRQNEILRDEKRIVCFST